MVFTVRTERTSNQFLQHVQIKNRNSCSRHP